MHTLVLLEVAVAVAVGVEHRALRERAGARSSSFRAPPREDSASPPVAWLAPNVLSVRHWNRLLAGALYAATPRVDWARLLRRTFSVDVLECGARHGRMRVLGSVTERDTVRAIRRTTRRSRRQTQADAGSTSCA